ncbi:lipoprotein NlpI [Pseudoalteromonas porphyrae]|uniref:Lipoprotein NlpI n=2 Tax=Pseudoalteromonas TaxID=53246 RepID=A0A0N1EGF9_9GAMM|nr:MULTISPECIES: lipoprotein NlpI [Pseudoalteromonas]KPH61004.1 lipoprotein NlpI [Pseudoalteromonas porphyrae]KPH93702.1 lipoprotein NlpI [Pseudoalteromonas porphyrae]NMR26452.1 lipoprotein NlpI [Pseudoalteromonas sp. NEC-BIFX-2020_015]NNG44311.1 lipoprotein NlpI [Pseudoalteromonas sp. NEC-BIFX-2020_002]
MILKHIALASFAVLSLSACQSTSQAEPTPIVNVPFTAPLASDFRSEIAIARYSELLNRTDLEPEQQAKLYYDRGVLFDSLGMPTLARIDFNRAVQLKPNLAEVYNFLGIHHTLMQQYEKAYELFDSALELNEQHEYAYLNRGIALYYGNRPVLASADLSEFLARAPSDPYRVLWLYLAQADDEPIKALANLKANAQGLDDSQWAYGLISLYLGDMSEHSFLATISEGVKSEQEYAQRLCEAYFYLAKMYQAEGLNYQAADFFRLTLATNVHEFVEYKYARLELELMAGDNAS